MKKTLKGYLLGFLSAAILVSGVTYAANTVRIVIDNKELIPTDVNGNRVDPIIIDGTTYLPVRAVANAFGEPVYWDGPNSTVYLGNMDGLLQYPTAYLEEVDNIGDEFVVGYSDELTDNYYNTYASAIRVSNIGGGTYETLLNMKYSKFKGTIYIPKGCSEDDTAKVSIKADGKIIYSSPEITKTSRPIQLDLNISGCDDFEIEVSCSSLNAHMIYIGDGGFYQ